MEKLIKSKKRVQDFAEVYTPKHLVNDMLDTIPADIWQNIESTFLEPACGNGNFLAVILKRKLKLCENLKDGLKALNSLYGVDIQQDNVNECRDRLLDVFVKRFSEICYVTDWAILRAIEILDKNIICDDMLNPQTEIVKSWGITPDKDYVKFLERRRNNDNT